MPKIMLELDVSPELYKRFNADKGTVNLNHVDLVDILRGGLDAFITQYQHMVRTMPQSRWARCVPFAIELYDALRDGSLKVKVDP